MIANIQSQFYSGVVFLIKRLWITLDRMSLNECCYSMNISTNYKLVMLHSVCENSDAKILRSSITSNYELPV